MTQIDASTMCTDLKAMRKSARIMQREAASSVGITQPYLSQIENGRRIGITLELYVKLFNLYSRWQPKSDALSSE